MKTPAHRTSKEEAGRTHPAKKRELAVGRHVRVVAILHVVLDPENPQVRAGRLQQAVTMRACSTTGMVGRWMSGVGTGTKHTHAAAAEVASAAG